MTTCPTNLSETPGCVVSWSTTLAPWSSVCCHGVSRLPGLCDRGLKCLTLLLAWVTLCASAASELAPSRHVLWLSLGLNIGLPPTTASPGPQCSSCLGTEVAWCRAPLDSTCMDLNDPNECGVAKAPPEGLAVVPVQVLRPGLEHQAGVVSFSGYGR